MVFIFMACIGGAGLFLGSEFRWIGQHLDRVWVEVNMQKRAWALGEIRATHALVVFRVFSINSDCFVQDRALAAFSLACPSC